MPAGGASTTASEYRVPSGVLSEVVDGETVLLHLDSGKYFGLNRTGTRIWQLILESATKPSIVSTVAREFGISEASAEEDLSALLRDLAAQGLLDMSG